MSSQGPHQLDQPKGVTSPGLVDELLRAVADDATANVMITSLPFDRVHHPYDGGADVLPPTTGERDALEHRHTDWLSSHPLGF